MSIDLMNIPVVALGTDHDIRLEVARDQAAMIRERNKPDCECEGCRVTRNLPAVQRILAKWRLKDLS